MMGQFEQLDQMLTAQEGMLRTSQVVSSDRKSTRLNSSHASKSRMPSSA